MSAPLARTRRLRRSARVLLLDRAGCVLLFRYTAPGFDPFWILPGGYCDPGEDFAAAAARELLEETGIAAFPLPTGIVNEADYEFLGEPVRAVEHMFWHRTETRQIDTSGHTEAEQANMREHRWFRAVEFSNWPEPVYPANLAELAECFAASGEGQAQ